MVYTIGFGMRSSPDVLSVIERNTAKCLSEEFLN